MNFQAINTASYDIAIKKDDVFNFYYWRIEEGDYEWGRIPKYLYEALRQYADEGE